MGRSGRAAAVVGLCLLLVAPLPAVAAPGEPRDTTAACAEVEPVDLPDVAGRHAEQLGCLVALDLAVGTTSGAFAPDEVVTRGQAATMLLRMLVGQRIDPVMTTTCEGVHGQATSVLVDAGVLDACDGAAPLTRSELAGLVVAVLDEFVGVAADAVTDQWPDDDEQSADRQRAHDVLATAGVLVGVPDGDDVRLRPDAPVRRTQAGLVVLRTHAWISDVLGPPGG